MNFLIHVTIFASDNYQGGSGKFFDSQIHLNFSSDVSLDFAMRSILLEVDNYKLNNLPHYSESRIIIKKIEILDR